LWRRRSGGAGANDLLIESVNGKLAMTASGMTGRL